MFPSTFAKQLLFVAVFETLYVTCQILFFGSKATSWSAALTMKPWLGVIYFVVTYIVVERMVRRR